MPHDTIPPVEVSPALLDAIAAFPLAREGSYCGTVFRVSPFDISATCPVCNARVKVRSFAAAPELEDVFDSVFTWMAQPGAAELVRRRQQQIAADAD